MTSRFVLSAGFLWLSSFCGADPAYAAARCEDLVKTSVPDATITVAERIAAGDFHLPEGSGRSSNGAQQRALASLPPFCRVALTSRPSSDSDIKIEVWLPLVGWNGKLQAVGDGGLAGFVPYALMMPALAEGYVTAGTDTGHVGGTAGFMPAHPEKLIDFAYRSTHQLAIAAKAITTAYYGNAATWTYYNACSGGGRHALTSAQRYPEDFQGIVAGAATWDQARLDAARIGINLTVNRTPESRIPASKYLMIHQAVLQACDANDGVRDGVLEDPRQCSFDYATLSCKGPDGPACLTTPQVESARALTSPFTDSGSGKTLLQAHLWPGSELQWGTLGGVEPLTNSVDRVRNFHLKDPAWEFKLANTPSDIERAVRMDNGLLASNNFDLAPFLSRGGKLLMWHGWSDPQVPAEHSIVFYESVKRAVGAAAADKSLALFMLPGVTHCGGGEGPDTFDKMAAITQWVEQGRKPSRIVAARMKDGTVERTRPLCPLGQVARYSGHGSTDDAANFACGAAANRAAVAR
jgi:feruloyl esterase